MCILFILTVYTDVIHFPILCSTCIIILYLSESKNKTVSIQYSGDIYSARVSTDRACHYCLNAKKSVSKLKYMSVYELNDSIQPITGAMGTSVGSELLTFRKL